MMPTIQRMRKLGCQPGAIRQKVLLAGGDPAWVDGPPGTKMNEDGEARRPLSTRSFPVAPALPSRPPGVLRKRVHCVLKPRRHKDPSRPPSFWESDEEKRWGSDKTNQLTNDIFSKVMKTVPATAVKCATAKPLICLLDLKKSFNMAITLARLAISPVELKNEILALNPTVLSCEQVQTLIDMWPDQDEQSVIDNFDGDISTVGHAEKFLLEVRSIPRFCEKLRCLLFKQNFPSRVHELRESIQLVIRGVHQLCTSSALQSVFHYVFERIVFLNYGPSDTAEVMLGIRGFSLDSLPKLSHTKAFDTRQSFLQFIVHCLRHDHPALTTFGNEVMLLQRCSRVPIASLVAEKRVLESGLQLLHHEAKTMVSVDGKTEITAMCMAQFATEVESELKVVDELMEQLDESKQSFLEHFEEQDSSDELDVLLGYIADFTLAFELELERITLETRR
ncbi:hypothetical protein Poli38472_014047 [Pythium oligandrum]|uniref:FH2 domain-containing protein n=1 Tax=Pythium oligandrum TaxID=41045 RepID=A0A8K1FK46_PYTOL|nr:hypothetical protein Poli38472_014047 [Pythium oligandrum]|eukprot:TMW66735.1 hypothetical protein Poli38472_014047 [Pythium oligandrum]